MTSISRREFTARSASVLAGALLPGARSTASRTAPRLIVRGDDMGYAHEQVAADRQGVTDMFTSSRAAERIKQRGIELIGYRDLRR